MKISIIGATGLVGNCMLRLLENDTELDISQIIPVASSKSIGNAVEFRSRKIPIMSLEDSLAQNADYALFSAGSGVSLEWAPKFSESGTVVVDNSSAWRMNEEVPLVIPEINSEVLRTHKGIIANPNCSTIQMLMALKPIHDVYGLTEITVSTYQAVTGTGYKAVHQLLEERSGKLSKNPVYSFPIDQNLIPQVDIFLDNGFTKEEMKMIQESRKILHLSELKVAATCVRVPVLGGHSESISAVFSRTLDIKEVYTLLKNMPGVVLQDDPKRNIYPMPRFTHGRKEVFVGRVRIDLFDTKKLHMWVVSDNLIKGAAWNAIQILKKLVEIS